MHRSKRARPLRYASRRAWVLGGAHHSRGTHYRQRGQEEGDEYEAAERPKHDPHARPRDRLRGAEALRPRARRLCCCQKPTGAHAYEERHHVPAGSGLPTMRSSRPVHYTPYLQVS